MKLYLISQRANTDYDTYDSAVVAAPDEHTARNMNPSGGEPVEWSKAERSGCCWTWAYSVEQVKVELIGVAAPFTTQGVICASFNAG